MQYATRQLVTRQDMRYMGRQLTAGETFEATEIDAGYFLQHHMCEAAKYEPAPVPEPQPARRGRPPKDAAKDVPKADAAAVEAPKAEPAQTPEPVIMTSADSTGAAQE